MRLVDIFPEIFLTPIASTLTATKGRMRSPLFLEHALSWPVYLKLAQKAIFDMEGRLATKQLAKKRQESQVSTGGLSESSSPRASSTATRVTAG